MATHYTVNSRVRMIPPQGVTLTANAIGVSGNALDLSDHLSDPGYELPQVVETTENHRRSGALVNSRLYTGLEDLTFRVMLIGLHPAMDEVLGLEGVKFRVVEADIVEGIIDDNSPPTFIAQHLMIGRMMNEQPESFTMGQFRVTTYELTCTTYKKWIYPNTDVARPRTPAIEIDIVTNKYNRGGNPVRPQWEVYNRL